MRDGISHVFSSFGSGSLVGRETFISEHCCFYPPAIARERALLLLEGKHTPLHIHPLAKLTTPYDLAYNQVRESRLRHGSVGVGIGATFSRNTTGYKLHAIDVKSPALLKAKLDSIYQYYSGLISTFTPEEQALFHEISSDHLTSWWASISCINFRIADYNYLRKFDTLIFEGAQGIMLDMDHGVFPNVTYGHCTSKNAHSICDFLKINDRSIYYVTRCYSTRHGNGWMPEERTIELINNENETNVSGEWQGDFRTGEIDTKLLNYALACDDIYSSGYEKNLIVTCLDQRPGFSFPYSKLTADFESIKETFSPHNSEETVTDALTNPHIYVPGI